MGEKSLPNYLSHRIPWKPFDRVQRLLVERSWLALSLPS